MTQKHCAVNAPAGGQQLSSSSMRRDKWKRLAMIAKTCLSSKVGGGLGSSEHHQLALSALQTCYHIHSFLNTRHSLMMSDDGNSENNGDNNNKNSNGGEGDANRSQYRIPLERLVLFQHICIHRSHVRCR